MREYLEKSVNGWLNFSVDGKLMALLIASIGILWLAHKKKIDRVFLYYLTIMTIACIFPLSACILMMYQTRFYDYPWIWSMVPISAGIAYAMVVITGEIWANLTIVKTKKVIFTAALIGIILLCGLSGLMKDGNGILSEEGEQVVEALSAMDTNNNMVWAPREIVTALRQRSGVKVLYGRNMWDTSVSAYSYDVYNEQVRDCFDWMEWAQNYDPDRDVTKEEAIKYLDGIECGNYAKEKGVTVIVLPSGFDEELARLMEADLGVMSQRIGGYHLIYCNYVLQFEGK